MVGPAGLDPFSVHQIVFITQHFSKIFTLRDHARNEPLVPPASEENLHRS